MEFPLPELDLDEEYSVVLTNTKATIDIPPLAPADSQLNPVSIKV